MTDYYKKVQNIGIIIFLKVFDSHDLFLFATFDNWFWILCNPSSKTSSPGLLIVILISSFSEWFPTWKNVSYYII